jgi:hypothetical protein
MLYPAEDYAIRQGFSFSLRKLPWRWKFELLEKSIHTKHFSNAKAGEWNFWMSDLLSVWEGLGCSGILSSD